MNSRNPDARVRIGITLSTTPTTLSLSSRSSFHVTVTARVLCSINPHDPVSFMTHLTPFDGLSTRAFRNMICTTDPNKHIGIWPKGWPQYRWDRNNLVGVMELVTVPVKDAGSLVVSHEVPRDAIEAANLKVGERYKVALTGKHLHSMWWAFVSGEEARSLRLVQRESEIGRRMAIEEERMVRDNEWYRQEQERERDERWGADWRERSPFEGEQTEDLALVPESWEVEFDVAE